MGKCEKTKLKKSTSVKSETAKTRREERDLNIEISFMEGVVKRIPEYTEAWEVLINDYGRLNRQEKLKLAEAKLKILCQ